MAGASFDIAGLLNSVDEIRDGLGDDQIAYRIVTNVEYAPIQEFGSSTQSAQPYLRPAADAVRPKVPSIVRRADSIKEAVRDVAMKCLRRAKEYCPVDTGRLRASLRVEEVGGGTLGEFSGGVDLGSGDVSGEVTG